MPIFRYIGLPALVAPGQVAIRVALGEAAEDLVADAQAVAPKDTGTLAAGITHDGVQGGGNSATVRVHTGGESSEYAIPQHEGSGPHRIEPRAGKALAFGGVVVAHVDHPGNPATKFLEEPLISNTPAYLAHLAAAARKAY